MRLALVLALVCGVLAVAARTASAEQTTRIKTTVSLDFTFPAGTLCDFTYQDSVTIDFNDIVFGDPNNPTRVIDHETQFVTHVNLDTGYTLTEVDHFTNTYVFTGPTPYARTVGLVWHLRDPSGKLVVVHAGQIVVDLNTGEIVKETPNFGPQGAAVICPALGGSPAI